MLFKLSNLNSNLSLTLGYLNPALNNSALGCTVESRFSDTPLIRTPRYILWIISHVPGERKPLHFLLIQPSQLSTPEKTKREMDTSFRCYDFWDHLSGQTLLMIGGWHPSTQGSSCYPSSSVNFPDKLDRWRQIRNRWGWLGTRLSGWYSTQSLSNACPPKQSQNSLHQKLIPSLPIVQGVGNAGTPIIRTLSMTPLVSLLTL